MEQKESILIVDDDKGTCRSLKLIFEKKGYETEMASTGGEAIEKVRRRFFNLALLDIRLPDTEGVQLLAALKEIHSDMVIIMMTAYASMETAMRALNEGAVGYITKPLNMDEVLAAVREAVEKQRLVIKNRELYQMARRELAERKRAEKALRHSEEKFRRAFRASPDWIVIDTLSDGRYIEVNENFLRMTGYRREEVVGRTSIELGIWVDPEDQARVLRTVQEEGSLRDLEVRHRMKSGEIRTFLMSSERIDLEGETCLISVCRDITDYKSLQNQLMESQKMEAIGRLAGGLAHDLNNVLTVIISCSSFLLMDIGQDDPLRQDAKEIKKAAKRAANIIEQLLVIGRRRVVEPRQMSLNACVADMEEMLKRLIGEDIHLVTMLDPGIGLLKADTGQVEQVIMNLVINARDAMPQGGKLTIETKNVRIDESYAGKQELMPPGHYVMLSVSDTGKGMDAETQCRIFEPFFSTKASGKGTGLGLSTAYAIIKQNGGHISVDSEPGQGTTFKFHLPRIDGVAEPDNLPELQIEPLEGSETILLVEDDDMVRNSAPRILRRYGYRVLTARGGEEALGVCEQHKGPIHLMVTDVVMPSMNGNELSVRLEPLRPNTRVLYISGYSDDCIAERGMPEPQENFLRKPFSAELLARRVRNLLDAPAG